LYTGIIIVFANVNESQTNVEQKHNF